MGARSTDMRRSRLKCTLTQGCQHLTPRWLFLTPSKATSAENDVRTIQSHTGIHGKKESEC